MLSAKVVEKGQQGRSGNNIISQGMSDIAEGGDDIRTSARSVDNTDSISEVGISPIANEEYDTDELLFGCFVIWNESQ